MAKIQSIHARIISDSRGENTIEVEIETNLGDIVNASVPNGTLKAAEKSAVLNPDEAIVKIHDFVAPKLIGKEINQREIDTFLLSLNNTTNDPTYESNLGINTLLPISIAIAKAGAVSEKKSLYRYLAQEFDGGKNISIPTPMFNMVNGGVHASNNIDFQEFMAVPMKGKTFTEKLNSGTRIFESLKEVLQERELKTDDGDEGGYAPDLETNEMVFGLMNEAIIKAGLKPGEDVFLALDVAASHLPPTFQLNTDRYLNMVNLFPIISLEDPLPDEDWDRWAQLKLEMKHSNKTGRPLYLVGDDLFVTSIERLKKGINKYVANGILIKINQVAVLSELFDIIKLAKENDYIHIISHRAGETMDTFIADLAVGTGAKFIKAGAPNVNHPERMAKYERLVSIEKELIS